MGQNVLPFPCSKVGADHGFVVDTIQPASVVGTLLSELCICLPSQALERISIHEGVSTAIHAILYIALVATLYTAGVL